MSEDSDPKIVDRLGELPPYTDKEGNVTGEEKEEQVTPQLEETTVEVPEEEETPETPITEEEALKASKQPEHTKKYIDKLKKQNETLQKNVLDSLQPEPIPEPPQWPQSPITNVIPTPQQYPGVSQQQITDVFKNLVDDNGYVDSKLLIDTLSSLREQNRQAEQRAQTAEQRAQKAEQDSKTASRRIDDFERNQIMREVHSKYPTLNPESENFDEGFWKFVRNEVVDQWMNGKPTDVMAAAEEGMRVLHPDEMKKADKEKLNQTQDAKKNINALGSSRTSQRDVYSDHDELVRATQLGKKGALAERLRKAGM